MSKNNVVLPQKAVAASELHPSLPKAPTLRLRSENGASIRGDSLFGELSVAHFPTKELGGGYRHIVRVNLREQGDIPPAGAQLTIINQDNVLGEDRARQAVHALLAAIVQLADETGFYQLLDTEVNGEGIPSSYSANEDHAVIATAIDATLKRVIGRES